MRDMLGEDLERMQDDAACNIRVVYFHWGREGRSTPKPYQRELAQFAADRGADLVLGSHPHVLQGSEMLKAADGSRVPVVYSMGNFVFAGKWNPKNKNSMIVKATFTLENGKRRRELELIPVFTDKFPTTPFQPYPQTARQSRKLLQQIDCRNGSGTPQYCGTDAVDEADPEPLMPGPTP
jgi:poly-gamma-glutamate synthesis protein (capsule biosynthesis protein)